MTEERGELRIDTEQDIITARRKTREISEDLGFGLTDTTRIVTATSELARNIYLYAGQGTVTWRTVEEKGRTGLEIVFEDQGSGIEDLDLAMQEGYTTSGGMGRGLPGSKRLMDHFHIESTPGQGTTITVRKYLG